jgi:ADP-dependent NAD(P)H-hydrate dehydratase
MLNGFLPDASAPAAVAVSNGIESEGTFRVVTEQDIKNLFKPRALFSHKGTYGHALLIAGAEKTMGAALLSAMGCLHAGAGLTTAAIPQSGLSALNTALPEVMYVAKSDLLSGNTSIEKYSAIGIGPGLSPGIGHTIEDIQLLEQLIRQKRSIVADADALPLIKPQFRSIAKDSILTPHVKEFDALFGTHKTWWERLETARDRAMKRGIVIVLKNQFTFIIDGAGTVYVNPTGNPAMAQGGMGDVLTGIITAYIAQQYAPAHAAILGCYFHGKAGDELAATHFNVSASKLASQLPVTIKNFLG